MSGALRIGIVGYGKIAQDRHVPAIASVDGIELVAVASRNNSAPGLPSFLTLREMLAHDDRIDAVALCQPPQARFEAARDALLAGKHVFLEKPPGATLSEVEALIALARTQHLTLFASWHSRESAGVAAAKRWLARTRIRSAAIVWKEDVRVWHPGQKWIWQPGGFGVFDPGINALSILTKILPEPVRVLSADLAVPSNCAAPIAARISMVTGSSAPIAAEFDFLQTGPQSWDIAVETDDGTLKLANGGNRLLIDGAEQACAQEQEYVGLYRQFKSLTTARDIDVDLAPLRLVADAFLAARIYAVEPFHD